MFEELIGGSRDIKNIVAVQVEGNWYGGTVEKTTGKLLVLRAAWDKTILLIIDMTKVSMVVFKLEEDTDGKSP